MKYLYRYSNYIILIWGIIILLFYKLYNNFVFKDNQSVVFVVLLFGLPLTLIFLKSINTKNKKRKWLKQHTDFYHQIIATIDKDLLPKLAYLGIKYEQSVLTIKDKIVIIFKETYAMIEIKDTLVKYYFHYGRNLLEMTKYDYYGLERRPISYFYQKLIDRIKQLTDQPQQSYQYLEYYQFKNIIGYQLIKDGEVIYHYQDKPKRKLNPSKAKVKEINI